MTSMWAPSAHETLRLELEKLEADFKTLCESNNTTVERKNTTRSRKALTAPSDVFIDDATASSSDQAPPTEEERLRRMMEEVSVEFQDAQPDLLLLGAKMDRANELYGEYMMEEMRQRLLKTTGTDVRPGDKASITVQSAIAAMDTALSADFSLAEYRRKPEQPKGFSRAAWMETVKMAKKLAELIAHMCVVQRSGDIEALNEDMAADAMLVAEQYMNKKKSNSQERNEQISNLVAHEIIKRVEDHEYFFCPFCNLIEFNVKQFLAHYATQNHSVQMKRLGDKNTTVIIFILISKLFINLTAICDDLHVFFSKVYTSPILQNGSIMPIPGKDTIPTLDFLAEIEKRYGQKINGDLDLEKLQDSHYIASVLPEIMKRHKSPIGKKMFAEFHKYLAKGKTLYCYRCRWTMSTRELFYRHHANPYHLSMIHAKDEYIGEQLNLLTVSINVHMRAEL